MSPKPLHPVIAIITARRIKGGGIVKVCRGSIEHRYRVSLRRYNRLRDTLNAHRSQAGGWIFSNDFGAHLTSVSGLREARQWAARYSRGVRAKHWQPIKPHSRSAS